MATENFMKKKIENEGQFLHEKELENEANISVL